MAMDAAGLVDTGRLVMLYGGKREPDLAVPIAFEEDSLLTVLPGGGAGEARQHAIWKRVEITREGWRVCWRPAGCEGCVVLTGRGFPELTAALLVALAGSPIRSLLAGVVATLPFW